MMSNTISPQAAADSSNQLIAPYIRLPAWWSMLMMKRSLEPGDAGAGQVAALHHDDRVRVRSVVSAAISMRSTPGNSK